LETILSFLLITSTFTMTSFQSCVRRPLEDVPVNENVTFDKHIQPITSTICVKCHSQGLKDFSKYDNAYLYRTAIRTKVAVDRTMPVGEYLSDQDRALFRDWVDQGGKK
jgi:hypothetical protein